MPSLRLYVSEEIAEAARAKAKAAGKSLSAYLADLVCDKIGGEWPPGFFEGVVGGWKSVPLRRPRQGRLERRDRV